jgi:hypothetical protein
MSFQKLLFSFCIGALMLFSVGQRAIADDAHPSIRVMGPVRYMEQDLYCDASYRAAECNQQIQMVLKELKQYPLEQLGPWTWILVRSDEWVELTQQLRLDSTSPAFTSLEERTTFLEEALVKPSGRRGAELMLWSQTPLTRLLDLALAHELGHALCRVELEGEANLIGQRLLRREEADCASLGRKTKELMTLKDGQTHAGK